MATMDTAEELGEFKVLHLHLAKPIKIRMKDRDGRKVPSHHDLFYRGHRVVRLSKGKTAVLLDFVGTWKDRHALTMNLADLA
jgi:hypothetical protein